MGVIVSSVLREVWLNLVIRSDGMDKARMANLPLPSPAGNILRPFVYSPYPKGLFCLECDFCPAAIVVLPALWVSRSVIMICID